MKVLIQKYIDGLLSEAEEKAFEQALKQDPELKSEYEFVVLFQKAHKESLKAELQENLKAALSGTEVLEEESTSITQKQDSQLPSLFPKSNERFGQWLSRSSLSIKGSLTFGSLPALIAASSLLLLATPEKDANSINFINPYAIQFVAVAIVTIWLYFITPKPRYYLEANRASLALGQFWQFWRLIWIAWLGLYFFLTLMQDPNYSEPAFSILPNFFNNLASFFIIICYHIIQKDTLVTKANSAPNTSPLSDMKVLLPNFKGIFFDADEFVGSKINAWRYLLIILIPLTLECVLWQTGLYAEDAKKLFGLLSGIIGGIASGLLFSKLNSKYLGLPDLYFIILLTYIVIQPAFNFLTFSYEFSNDAITETLGGFFAYSALLLKLALLTIIQWLIYSNRMLYYFGVSIHLDRSVHQHREEMLDKINAAEPMVYKQLWNVKKG